MQLHAIGSAIALLALAGCSAQGGDEARQENGVTAQRSHFGTLADDTPIEAVTLTNDRGVSARIKIGRAHVCTQVTNAHLVCRLLLEKKKQNKQDTNNDTL